MSSVSTPQKKKQLAYERDHYAKSKRDKARKAWRTSKHKTRRSYRHAADSLTRAAAFDGESDAKISTVRQRSVRRWPVPPLRELVAHKLDKRVRGVGAKKWRALRAAADRALDHAPYSRPEKDFCVDSVASSLRSVRRRAEAGSPDVPRQIIVRRFWQYLRFLQSHGHTLRTIARSLAEVNDATELRNSDLTDTGFRFVRYSHLRWIQRRYKDEGARKEDGYLRKWYEKFQHENTAV
jgi:hypothetical protein